MTVKEFLGVDAFDRLPDGTELSHREKYSRIVNAIGLDRVIKYCLPFTLEEVRRMHRHDEHLNMHMNLWNVSSGIRVTRDHNFRDSTSFVGSPLTEELRKLDIRTLSQSEGVCILKEAAKMWMEREDAKKE